MRLPIYQVDAFTDSLFGGNPAAVCPLEAWLPEKTMQAIAAENNLAETAFFVREGPDYALRWFTPTVEVTRDSCGRPDRLSLHRAGARQRELSHHERRSARGEPAR